MPGGRMQHHHRAHPLGTIREPDAGVAQAPVHRLRLPGHLGDRIVGPSGRKEPSAKVHSSALHFVSTTSRSAGPTAMWSMSEPSTNLKPLTRRQPFLMSGRRSLAVHCSAAHRHQGGPARPPS